MTTREETKAELLAAALKGAWREEPPPYEGEAGELEAVLPLLVGSGSGALAWWKLRETPLAETEVGRELRQAYLFHTIEAAVREREVAGAASMLAGEGIEPLLIKGAASARFYAETGLRPYSDIDLCVRPSDYARAESVLKSPAGLKFFVDLHAGFDDLGARDAEKVFGRASWMELGGARVRVLAPEEHLRLVSTHCLKHGAWRPAWLCDVAATVETRAEDFDWRRALGESRREARRVECAAGLAATLLGARLEGTPLEGAHRRLPRWLLPGVLRQWERPLPALQAPMRHHAPMRSYLRRPAGLLEDLRNRWPDPIAATAHTGGHFNGLPRLPFQIGEVLARTTRFLLRLPRELRSPR